MRLAFRLSAATLAVGLIIAACSGGTVEETGSGDESGGGGDGSWGCTFSGNYGATCSGCTIDSCTLTCESCMRADGSPNPGPSLPGPCEQSVTNCDGELVCGTCASVSGGGCYACACGGMGGCAEQCSAASTGLQDFCDGTTASIACEDCINITCGASVESCTP